MNLRSSPSRNTSLPGATSSAKFSCPFLNWFFIQIKTILNAEHQNMGKHGFFVPVFSLFGWVLYILKGSVALHRGDPDDFVNLTFKFWGKTEKHLRFPIKLMDYILSFPKKLPTRKRTRQQVWLIEGHVQKITDRLVRKTRNFLMESQLELVKKKHGNVDRWLKMSRS